MTSDEIANDSRVYKELEAAEKLTKNLTFFKRGVDQVMVVSIFLFVISRRTPLSFMFLYFG
jgi:hypothetical protein